MSPWGLNIFFTGFMRFLIHFTCSYLSLISSQFSESYSVLIVFCFSLFTHVGKYFVAKMTKITKIIKSRKLLNISMIWKKWFQKWKSQKRENSWIAVGVSTNSSLPNRNSTIFIHEASHRTNLLEGTYIPLLIACVSKSSVFLWTWDHVSKSNDRLAITFETVFFY